MDKLNCIMLVDDDRLTNFLNKIVIDIAGVANHVVRQMTGESAIQYLLESSNPKNNLPFPDLILLDIVMPVMSGWDFMRLYKAIKKKFLIPPFIVILALDINLTDILDSSSSMELCEVYAKPLTTDNLKKIIENCSVKDMLLENE